MGVAQISSVPASGEIEEELCAQAEPDLYEAALLVAILRGDAPEITDGIDWNKLCDLATKNGVLAFVHDFLLEAGQEIPLSFMQAAKERRTHSARCADALRALLVEFEKREVDILPLKGPALSLKLYGDATLRQSNDLDLLVRGKDFARAEALLTESGYRPHGTRNEYHRAFLRDGLVVELHFRLSTSRNMPLNVEQMWRRVEKTEFLGAPASAMRREDLALYLCFHGLKHEFSRLIWILDIAQALRGWSSEEYKSLLELARRQDLEQWLLIAFEMARTMLPRHLPEELEAVISSSPLFESAQRTAAEIFSGKQVTAITDYRRFYLQTGRNRLKRWRYRFSLFTLTPADYAWAGRHKIDARLAIAFRPLRLLRKYGVSGIYRMLFPPQG